MTSPIDGVVFRWRVRADSTEGAGNPARLKVIRPAAGGSFIGVNTSGTSTVPLTVSPTTHTFATQQPIAAGDLIAIDVDAPNGNFTFVSDTPVAGTTDARWDSPPALGIPDLGGDPGPEVFINADVEADANCDGLGDETQDPAAAGGYLPVTAVSLPAAAAGLDAKKAKTNGKNFKLKSACPAGGGDCEDNAVTVKTAKRVRLSATAAAKKKEVLLGKGSFSIPASATQKVKFKLKSKGRKLFEKQKTVKAKVKVKTGVAASVSSSGHVTIKLK